ncbi:MAG TPA: ADP-forming succinate--CoA ligase subunit beta, partial [Deltaproteobacteria bacterium]|nr:ADP-forming succinate--CoA ligase subunit beta [Deltaproteobacteria bacterium]
MKIHEYQGKQLLGKYGVPVPEGRLVISGDEAYHCAKQLGGTVVVKAQIHAGGRGKGGGVKVAKTAEEAKNHAQQMLGMHLKTHQTGPEGQMVRKVWVERACNIGKEYYLGMVLDRAASRIALMASTEGGMEIEEVAARAPEKILKVTIDPAVGFQAYQGRELAFGLGLPALLVNKFVKFAGALAKAYVEADCSLLEINPLVLTQEGDLLALDAKVNFDDNALYRHPDYEDLRDLDEENPHEIEAKKFDLSYISLDGNIGCMVNG